MGTSQVHLANSPALTLILISPRKREKGRAGQSKLAAPDGGHPRGSSAPHGGARQPRGRPVAPWERPWTQAAPIRAEGAALIHALGGSHPRGGGGPGHGSTSLRGGGGPSAVATREEARPPRRRQAVPIRTLGGSHPRGGDGGDGS